MEKVSNKKILQLIYLFLFEVIIGIILFSLNVNVLVYIFLSWTLPTIFILIKLKTYQKKYILTSFAWCIPMSILIDFSGHIARSWDFWSNPRFAVTGISFLNIPFESFFWGFSLWLFTVSTYEYFFDKRRNRSITNKGKLFLLLCYISAAIFLLLVANGVYLPLSYHFLKILIAASLIILVLLIRRPHLFSRAINFGIISFFFGIIVEFYSLALGLWKFPSQEYISTFSIIGHLIPIEEIIWWIIVPILVMLIQEILFDTGD